MSTVFRAISDHRILAYKGDTDDWAIERGAPPERAEMALLEARIAELNEPRADAAPNGRPAGR
jgi:hypothetical protein